MRFRRGVGLACLPLLSLLACPGSAPPPEAPATPTREGDATTYFETEVQDPYRWLEDGESTEVKDWIRAQNEHAARVLDSFSEGQEIAERVRQLATTSPDRSSPKMHAGVLFFLRETPPQPQPVLVAQEWPAGEERVIVDLNAEGGHVVITDYWPSPSGRLVAYGTAEGGDELTTIHFFDLEKGKTLSESLPYAGGGTSPPALAWDADERGVIYMRFPIPPAGQPLRPFDAALFHHVLDQSAPDSAVLGEGYSPIAEYLLLTSADGGQVAALAKKGDGGPWDVFLQSGAGWRHALDESAGVTTATYLGDRLLVVATAGTPRGRIFAVEPDGKQTALVAEGDRAIQAIAPIGRGFLVARSWGPDWRVDQYDAAGGFVRQVPLTDPGIRVEEIASESASDAALIAWSGWTTPTRWMRYDGRTGESTTVFEVEPASDYSKVRMDRLDATSKDGTTVPVVVLSLDRGPGDGPAPTILTGYGGFGVPYAPRFIGSRLAWLERGGLLAFANLRGGGEFGEEWHAAGMRTNKQNVFDDFHAAAQALIDSGRTTVELLGAQGGSNGGLLMGAQLTQHPETYRAIVSFVGIYDMLRHETFPNGAYNVTEYGATSNPEEFAALYAYSPLHRVVAGTRYPAVLLETGVNDMRVAPWQSRKFAAALQAADAGDRPVLLVTREDAGHGVGASFDQRVGNEALALTFFAHELR